MLQSILRVKRCWRALRRKCPSSNEEDFHFRDGVSTGLGKIGLAQYFIGCACEKSVEGS